MKKLGLFLIVSLFLIFSCETSEDAETGSEAISSNLVGTWKLIQITSEDGRIGSATSTDTNYFEILYIGEGSNLDVQMTFAENPNALDITGEGFLYERTVTETTENIEVTGEGIIADQWTFAYDFLAPGNGWKVEEEKYIFDHVDGSLRVDYGPEILEVNETTLKLKMKYNDDYPKSGQYFGRETCVFYATFQKI